MARAKSHLLKRKNLLSTTQQSTDITPDLFPPLLNKDTNVAYVAFFQADLDKKIVCTDLTQNFSMTLITGNK